MKQKNNKWIFFVLIAALLAGGVYLATKDFTPQSSRVEKEISVF